MSTNYTSSSIKKREEKQQEKEAVSKVVKGRVKTKKKSEISKITSNIISDEVKSIKEYAVYDVIIPVVKDTISQLIKGSIDMMFWGEVRPDKGRSGGSTKASKVSYRDYYGSDRKTQERERPVRYSYDDIAFEFKQDADDVLDRMDEIVEQYRVVTVGDLFDLAGKTGNPYTDNNYGWTTTRGATVERDRNGDYYIKLPRPSSII